MLRAGHATLPSAFLLNCGTRRTLKTKNFDGRGFPQSLSISSLTMCRVFVSPKHRISHNAYKILSDRSHVLYLPTRKRFQAILDGDERQVGLRMDFTSNPMQKKRVVRSWATRRIDQAVTGALRMRGFDKNGKRLVDSDASPRKGSKPNSSPVTLTWERTPEALIGTVDVHVLQNSIETSFTEVQRQAGVMVDNILEICGRYPRIRQYERQQKPGLTPYSMIDIEHSS